MAKLEEIYDEEEQKKKLGNPLIDQARALNTLPAMDYNQPNWWQKTDGYTPGQLERMPIETIHGSNRTFYGPSTGLEYMTPRGAYEGIPEQQRLATEAEQRKFGQEFKMQGLENMGRLAEQQEQSRGALATTNAQLNYNREMFPKIQAQELKLAQMGNRGAGASSNNYKFFPGVEGGIESVANEATGMVYDKNGNLVIDPNRSSGWNLISDLSGYTSKADFENVYNFYKGLNQDEQTEFLRNVINSKNKALFNYLSPEAEKQRQKERSQFNSPASYPMAPMGLENIPQSNQNIFGGLEQKPLTAAEKKRKEKERLKLLESMGMLSY